MTFAMLILTNLTTHSSSYGHLLLRRLLIVSLSTALRHTIAADTFTIFLSFTGWTLKIACLLSRSCSVSVASLQPNLQYLRLISSL